MNVLNHFFKLNDHQTSWKQEMLAGFTTYFTVVYILVVNSVIIADSGIPFDAAMVATVLASFTGCFIMGFWANSPIILVPGMGVNAFFTYTIVKDMGLTWQEALAVVFLSGLMFIITAFTRLSFLISIAIPHSLKKAITVGIGLLITFIGLQKGGIIVANQETYVSMGEITNHKIWLTLGSFVFTVALFIRKIPGSFLIGISTTSLFAAVTGLQNTLYTQQSQTFSFSTYLKVMGSLSFEKIGSLTFWSATLVLAMVLIFENIGLLQGLLEDKSKFQKSFQANALASSLSGILGTSPTVSSLESATGIASGGKTGVTSITSGLLFLATLFVIPYIKWIPDSAIAAILIIVGSLMIQDVQEIPLKDLTEGIPAFITLTFIPFTYSIPDGIAFGFIAYALLKLVAGKIQDAPFSFYFITGLFVIQLILH